MCASYGLDPRFQDSDAILARDQELLADLRAWAVRNDGAPLRPTGKNLRNLNPIVAHFGGRQELEMGWWGYLVDGAPAPFASINTRSERLMARADSAAGRAIVPATAWFEMRKPRREWFSFAEAAGSLLAMAAVTRPGRTADGAAYTCYSIVMRPAPEALSAVHDRVPLLLPATFVPDWLESEAPLREVVDAALGESESGLERVRATPIPARP